MQAEHYKIWSSSWKDKDEENPAWGVEILEGQYKDMVVQIQDIDIKDITTGECIVEYHVLSGDNTGLVHKTDEFQKYISDIVQDIVENAVLEAGEEYDANN